MVSLCIADSGLHLCTIYSVGCKFRYFQVQYLSLTMRLSESDKCTDASVIAPANAIRAPVQGESLLFDDVAPIRHIQTVQELPDVLVPHSARLLDICCAL